MAKRLPTYLPRIAVLVLLALGATAGLTLAAGNGDPAPATVTGTAITPPPPMLVPDVRNQAFVFAKGALADAGFAWRVVGSVKGYAANVVVSQSPAAGTHLIDTGAPLITLTLKRNSSYPQAGDAADVSPYRGTLVEPSDLAGNAIGPVAPAKAPATTAPATTTATTPTTPAKTAATAPKATTTVTKTTAAAPATPAKPATTAKAAPTAKWPQSRPTAFDAPGATKEPLDEMPLPNRAQALMGWLDTHQTKSAASAKYWLYQNEWIVTGAKMGWWRGAEALKILVAVDRRTQSLWGIGAASESVAQQTLDDVRAKAKS